MYLLVKIWVRTGLQFYCGKIDFDRRLMDKGKHPLILACSHPNSFFDALVMGAYHPRRLHFLARGDAFKNPRAAKVLRLLNMIPIYRLSEGKEHINNNRDTFDECGRVFKNNGTVLIFSEGICINEWNLRPLKKGTARLAWMCWQEHGIKDMVIQPVGINYHSFTEVPKRVNVQFGEIIRSGEFDNENAGTFYHDFNSNLHGKLEKLVVQKDSPLLKKKATDTLYKAMLTIPAVIGFILHRAFFVQWRNFIREKTKGTVFFDSVLFASLLIIYPVLVLIISATIAAVTGNSYYWLLMVLIPFTAWSYKQYKSI